jgi:hypothetical protein
LCSLFHYKGCKGSKKGAIIATPKRKRNATHFGLPKFAALALAVAEILGVEFLIFYACANS